MINLKLTLIVAALVYLNIGCKMKKVLPAATEQGLNTFGVKIDNKVWLPAGSFDILGGSPLRVEYYKDNGVFGITAQKATNKEVMLLTVLNVKSVGFYFLNVDKKQGSETEYHGKLVDDDYYPYAGGINKVNITKLDTTNKIVSGTFEVQLKGKKNDAIKNLTHGIFDVKYEN